MGRAGRFGVAPVDAAAGGAEAVSTFAASAGPSAGPTDCRPAAPPDRTSSGTVTRVETVEFIRVLDQKDRSLALAAGEVGRDPEPTAVSPSACG